MEDIDLARSLLEEEKCNLVIVKKGDILFSSKERGIASFIQAIQRLGKGLHNAAMADRIVGLAVAMLCIHARIASVYANIGSQEALDLLKGRGVAVSSQHVVPHIFNYDGTDLCPFEKIAKSSENSAQLFSTLKSMFGGLDGNREAFT